MPAIELVKHDKYINNDINYLKNIEIAEYDIQHAGPSVIKHYKLLPDEEINKIFSMPKKEANIYVGKQILKYPDLGKKILEGIAIARQKFVTLNNIEEEDILSIRKDAIFIIKKNPKVLLIDEDFLFRKKNSYTSFIRLDGKEFYVNGKTKELDWKNLSDGMFELYNRPPLTVENYKILQDIRDILLKAERLNEDDLARNLRMYVSNYKNKRLPIETYRNLNTGAFEVRFDNKDDIQYGTKKNRKDTYRFEINKQIREFNAVGKNEFQFLDISQNYINYIRPLIGLLL